MIKADGSDTKVWSDGQDESGKPTVAYPEEVSDNTKTDAWPGVEASDYKIKTISDDGLSKGDDKPFYDNYIINTTK
jgi:hypothetical protein